MEIERKWLVKSLPDISKCKKVVYERHILYSDEKIEVRITKKDNVFLFERKVTINETSRDNNIFEITEAEYEFFRGFAKYSLERDGYNFSDNPKLSIKVYKGKYGGLNRVEVEFDTEENAKKYVPLKWFGKEITGTALANDKKLVTLSVEELKKLLSE
ncbi:MAG TPA: hypothetical protein PLV59_02540 [Candidatus Dojkabacteria bacterium]|nr:hypothetical protein [Candidatus Dojkabacteria bacterium]